MGAAGRREHDGRVVPVGLEHKFPIWIRKAFGKKKAKKGVLLVHDHEKCLWKDGPLQAMRDNGINLMKNYPKFWQALNAIETAWRELRARLYVTQPVCQETREAFIIRLRAAVSWILDQCTPSGLFDGVVPFAEGACQGCAKGQGRPHEALS